MTDVGPGNDRDWKIAFDALLSKRERVATLWDYYWGNQPLRYSSERLKRLFSTLNVRFVQNWCGVIIDSASDRLNLTGFFVADSEENTNLLNDEYQRMELNLDSHDVHLAALVTGESFVFVWPEEDGELSAYYHDPRLCHIEYDQEKPREKRFAAKVWEEDEYYKLVLYYTDRIEWYTSNEKVDSVSSQTEFTFEKVDRNPFGVIPIFHFRRSRIRTQGELDSIITMQDAINKLLADMMVAAEFGAFPQRYIISQATDTELESSPGHVWTIPSGDGKGQQTSVGQLESAYLDNYLKAIDSISQSISVITRTPRHYFWGHTGQISGEALMAMESPLNKKVGVYIQRFGAVWQQVAKFVLQIHGIEAKETGIYLQWSEPETVQPRTMAEIRDLSARTGLPMITILRREGWLEPEMEEMIDDYKMEKELELEFLERELEIREKHGAGTSGGDFDPRLTQTESSAKGS